MLTSVTRPIAKSVARRWTLFIGLLATAYALCTLSLYLRGCSYAEDSHSLLVRLVRRKNGDLSRKFDQIQNSESSSGFTRVYDSKIHDYFCRPKLKDNASSQPMTTTVKDVTASFLPTSQLRAVASKLAPSMVVKNSFQKDKPIAVVFADVNYDDFVQNCFKSFNLFASTAQFLAVGLDEGSSELFGSHGIPSISMDGLISEFMGDSNFLSTDAASQVESIAGGNVLVKSEAVKAVHHFYCRRLEVVLAMLKDGYSVFLLDSDIALTSSPWFGKHTDLLDYVQSIDADIATGHGTYPPASYYKKGFTIQGGFHYAKPTPAVIHLFEEVVGSCQGADGDDQTVINEAFDSKYEVVKEPEPESDVVGTRIYQVTSEDESVEKLNIAVLGSKFFPTGCKYVAEADEFPMIRHPACVPGVISNAAYKRRPAKVQSLIDQGAWYNDPAHKAILWSFPGSGNTMLRFTFERLVGKVGSTNSIYHDRTLGITLPGELYTNGGLLVKVHPGVPKGTEDMEIDKGLVFKTTPKRILIVREPYDAIWSWYQLLVTGSHAGRVSMEDFSIEHFAAQAILWAKKFQTAVQDELIPFARDHPDDLLLIKFEDLMKEQDKYLTQILGFVNEKPAGDYANGKLGIIDHPSIRRDAKKDTDVSKAFAYAHSNLVNQMWKIFSSSANEYSYVKPAIGSASKTQLVAEKPSALPTHARGRHRYFTFYPTGGLSNQLLELEVAVELAQRSNRTLLLPPLVAESIKIFPQVWQDDSEKRHCTNETLTMSSCNYDLSKIETHLWDQLIDMEHLATRVPVVLELPPDVMSKMSQLTLCKYHKCNTRWLVRDLYEQESCLPGYVSDHTPIKLVERDVVTRSSMCVFNSAKGINIVKFGALLGVSPIMPAPRPQFIFKKEIREASEEISNRLRALSFERVYNCAHLRVAGSHWEKDSPFIADRKANLEMQVEFLESVDPEKKNPLFIATDNEEFARNTPSICGVRKCYFVSDFKDITEKYGLSHFQQLIPVDYSVCGCATAAKASVRSSVGYIIKFIHDQQKARNHASGYQTEADFAYVTLLARNPDEKQRSMYVTAVRALIHSLEESGTTAHIVVLMTYSDAKVKKTLEADGAIVKQVQPLVEPKKVDDFLPWFTSAALAKLRVFELTQYKKIQFLDADVVILKHAKLDALFNYRFAAPLVAEGLGTDSPIRGGWFMVRPAEARFKVLLNLIKRGMFSKEKGWDNLDLAVDYPGWHPNANTTKWGFYGSQLEQGALYHNFYALPKAKNPTKAPTEMLEIFNDAKMVELGMVHCYGDRKPWNKDVAQNKLNSWVVTAHSRWADVVKTLGNTPMKKLGYTAPLSVAGARRYLQEGFSYPEDLLSSSNSTASSFSPTPGSVAPSFAPSLVATVSLAPSVTLSKAPSNFPTTTNKPSPFPSTSPSSSPTTTPQPSIFDPCRTYKYCSRFSVCNTVDVDGVLTPTCECFSGYEEIDRVCVDINECERFNPCEFGCIDTDGSFTCLAEDGSPESTVDDFPSVARTKAPTVFFAPSVTLSKAPDISPNFSNQPSAFSSAVPTSPPSTSHQPSIFDPCRTYKFCSRFSVCQAVDVNGVLIPTCICASGYEEIDRVCVDINECERFNPCEFACIDTDGSFTCLGEDGFPVSKEEEI